MAESRFCSRRRKIVLSGIAVSLVVAVSVVLITVFATKNNDNNDNSGDPKATDNPASSTTGSRLGIYKHAAVATDEGRCSTIGKDIMLKKNGSAVDAAIATMLCIGVLNAHSTGIGGGSFMVVYDRPAKKATTYDFRESAPGGATEDMFNNDHSLKTYGGLSIGVPGEVRGYWSAHQNHGRLAWSELFQPAITLCRDGFELGVQLAAALQSQKTHVLKNEGLRDVFIDKTTGTVKREGDLMKFPKLANTLQAIASEGPDAFYNGSLTQLIVDDIKDHGGIITAEDLANYTVNIKAPVVGKINDLTVYGVRPPSSGGLIQFMLNLIEGFVDKDGKLDGKDPLTYHRIVETFKFAYARRSELGDEDYSNLKSLLENLMSKVYAASVRPLITDNTTHGYEYYGSTFYDQPTTGTSHASILAPNGDAVALTSTINYFLGSKILGKRTGILFNNEMGDFAIPTAINEMGVRPSPVNFVQPGKRPISSMCPTVLVDGAGDVKYVIGGSGGSRITSAVAYVLSRSIWFGDSIKNAIDARRMHHQLLPPYISVEEGFPQYIIDDLLKRHHNVSKTYKLKGTGSSIVQAIQIVGGEIHAVSDFRKTGYPDGF